MKITRNIYDVYCYNTNTILIHDRKTLLVLWIGEGTSAGFTVVTETLDHTVEPWSAAFTVIALRVVLTILHKHIIIMIVICENTSLAPIHSLTRHDLSVKVFNFPITLQLTTACLCARVSGGWFYLQNLIVLA